MAHCLSFFCLTSFGSGCHKNAALIANTGAVADGGFSCAWTEDYRARRPHRQRALSLSDTLPLCLLREEEPSPSPAP